jgi:hypothetical protein
MWIGAQFDTAYKEGAHQLPPGNAACGAAQELDLQPGEGGFVEFTPPAPACTRSSTAASPTPSAAPWEHSPQTPEPRGAAALV